MAATPSNIQVLPHAHDFRIDQQIINIFGNVSNERRDLILRLNPITDASHTRNRKTSPPDSECFPGTRKVVIKGITSWADTRIVLGTTTAHVYWSHGFAGSGKSAISLEIARIYASSGRLLASYFFFRNAGERSEMTRFAGTLASQLAAAVPATASFIKAAIEAEPGLLTQGVSLATQLEQLFYEPFRAAVKRGAIVKALTKGPFVVVIDGLDECEDKQGVTDFVDHMLDYFKRHPSIPLRFFIASRVEEHIRTRLQNDVVVLDNLDSHGADKDIEMYLEGSFQAAALKDRVIQEYAQAHGKWPTQSDMNELIVHIKGSFVLASTMFKFIVQPAAEEDPSTPMKRLPLTLKLNGLDPLYAQTLARSQHLSHFCHIISTIALLSEPLPIVKLASLLGIEAFEIVHVLLNLQAIIHVPGTDQEGEVTLCHTSLRDFLTTESRSGQFFVPPSFHLYLYGKWSFVDAHWRCFVQSGACDFVNEIERFKACQPLHVDRIPYCAFLCTMVFYSLLKKGLDNILYALTESASQLALAVESPDPRIRLWLEASYDGKPDGRLLTVQFTEQIYETLKHDLQRASTAIRDKFTEISGCRYVPNEEESRFRLFSDSVGSVHLSGIKIFNTIAIPPDLILRLNPIIDASHTRNLKTSPPDSECFPGTRRVVIKGITNWADTRIVLGTTTAHVYWFHGFAGSGKSAVSLEIARIYAGSGRLLASYFFFRGAGDRSGMTRFAVTLASQLVAAVPATAPFIGAAIEAEPGLLTQGVSLATQLERLIYEPFRAAVKRGVIVQTLIKGPFVVVIDGLDECEDKQGVMDFIDHMLDYFKRHSSIPLRFFIASRVEEHIRTRLQNDGVRLDNLPSHGVDKDIEMFLEGSFKAATLDNCVIQEYVRARGEWPTTSDMNELIMHINGSFVLASTVFKFIVQPATEEDPSTPMERLPLTLKINGLDPLYAQTLARSQHLPHFRHIISTIALLSEPLPVVGIASLLGIEAFEEPTKRAK
ncbi:hypothetical protein EST38_g13978 [Candolleomyces aberdarensis]|uniref:Nephrocystin 3-like N-terminal domain-containing protein n=1 Tax=Candolleomyces aberdarensis TaxID=2316362 RepID=A0A4Q2CYH2_9AGAR|nr:hypothetical protein EST38_g13978 [Candolleomyces aberdarensis]